jgi:hypothetical protein
MKLLVLAGVTIAALLFTSGCCTTQKAHTAWEYKVVGGGVTDSLERNINNAASDGWQVVSASKYGGDGNAAFVVMRRPKRTE